MGKCKGKVATLARELKYGDWQAFQNDPRLTAHVRVERKWPDRVRLVRKRGRGDVGGKKRQREWCHATNT